MFGLKRFKIRMGYHEILRERLKRLFRDIDQIIVQQQFTTSTKDFILLCDITWKEKIRDPEKLLQELINDIDVINDILVINSDLKNNRTLCFIKGVHDERYTEIFMYTTREFLCFIEYPLIAKENYGTLTLVGVPKDVTRLIEFMKEFGSEHKIIAVKNYYTKDQGILSVLTDKQLTVLKNAFDHGFFAHPRKTNARKISKSLGIAHTTFLIHIRKSQNRIFSALLRD